MAAPTEPSGYPSRPVHERRDRVRSLYLKQSFHALTYIPSNMMPLAAKKPPTGITIMPRENIISTPYAFMAGKSLSV